MTWNDDYTDTRLIPFVRPFLPAFAWILGTGMVITGSLYLLLSP